MGRSRYNFIENQVPHFLTCTILNWIPLFASPAIVKIILDSFEFLQENKRLIIYAYVILENHLHMIASGEKLSKEIGNFKTYTARTIIDYLVERKAERVLKQLNYYKLKHRTDRNYQLWQEDSHPEQIQNAEMMVQKIEYTHWNPVKRGYVDEPVHWRYSSARNYADMEGLLEITRFSL